MAHHSSKRKIWEFVTYQVKQDNLAFEEVFNLEIEISNLKQSLQEAMPISKKKKLLKKLRTAEKRLLEIKPSSKF